MSRFSGPQTRGALRAHRAVLRSQAEERNAATPLERTAKFRRDRVVVQAAVAEAAQSRAARKAAALAACRCGHSQQMHQLDAVGFCQSAGCHCARYRLADDEAVAS